MHGLRHLVLLGHLRGLVPQPHPAQPTSWMVASTATRAALSPPGVDRRGWHPSAEPGLPLLPLRVVRTPACRWRRLMINTGAWGRLCDGQSWERFMATLKVALKRDEDQY